MAFDPTTPHLKEIAARTAKLSVSEMMFYAGKVAAALNDRGAAQPPNQYNDMMVVQALLKVSTEISAMKTEDTLGD